MLGLTTPSLPSITLTTPPHTFMQQPFPLNTSFLGSLCHTSTSLPCKNQQTWNTPMHTQVFTLIIFMSLCTHICDQTTFVAMLHLLYSISLAEMLMPLLLSLLLYKPYAQLTLLSFTFSAHFIFIASFLFCHISLGVFTLVFCIMLYVAPAFC